jgi:DNA-nicking Smr family endonuclease
MRRHRSQKDKPTLAEPSFKNQPFRALRGVEVTKTTTPQPVATRKSVAAAEALDPEDSAQSLFQAAMSGVAPLDEQRRQRVATPPPATPARPVTHPDAEALAELCDLVAGNAAFDITDSDEYVEGLVAGADPRLVRRLRRGEFAYQAHIDLHGMTSDEARSAVGRFLTTAFQDGKRCVLIIHGRGRNSTDQVPVLKTRLTGWLARGQWSRLVLAFSSARACDGGVGALYVLLRRRHDRKRRIKVVNGAKH